MKEHYFGFNFHVIPKYIIPFRGHLDNGDVIINENGRELFWSTHDNGFKLVTDDAYDYLEKEEINTYWKKHEF